jgi:hypothetical protein
VIRNPFRRAVSVPAHVLEAAALAPGEKVLAGVPAGEDTWLLGTRAALHLVPAQAAATRIPWEHVERADWDRDEERLLVLEVGEFGRPRPQHAFAVSDPGVLLELLRERVTASVVLQRRVPVQGKRGLLVIARRSPAGGGELTWAYEFDRGVDPDDPAVRRAAEAGLRAARSEIGM